MMRKHLVFLAGALAFGCGESPPPVTATPADDGTGEVLDTPDPSANAPDPCIEQDLCPDELGAGGSGGSGGAGGSGPVATYTQGDRLMIRKYAAFKKAADPSAASIESIPPKGGVIDDDHTGMPLGMLSPGQEVVVIGGVNENKYFRVTYQGQIGYVLGYKLYKINDAMHPVELALQPEVRNAFFKHQLRRGAWNKDGPSASANCAAASLAMAARILGKEPVGKSIEESIHRVRSMYGVDTDKPESGTLRSQINAGAKALGLQVKELTHGLATAAEMDRLDEELNEKHLVVLEGIPGQVYRDAMSAAYEAAGQSLSYTYTGKHSILIVGMDSGGNYVIADPLSEAGMVTMPRETLQSFMDDQSINSAGFGGTGNAIWLAP